MITAIILAHYKEREHNLPIIVNDLLSGTVKPDEIVVFVDNLLNLNYCSISYSSITESSSRGYRDPYFPISGIC